ncbi:hypothetical protein [Sphingomonas sp.]|uniref:hypothetical protein n=1 Tax=Sphingomonas sp. TaxID=28214 RepID=UPI003B002E83
MPDPYKHNDGSRESRPATGPWSQTDGEVVEQVDREEAGKVMISREAQEDAVAGRIDDNSIVQAFARHRRLAVRRYLLGAHDHAD